MKDCSEDIPLSKISKFDSSFISGTSQNTSTILY
jgi:hypothetical protein